jgi:CheY-like chemotaxis protein
MADVGQLEQVLINLAVNARDAMPEGGRLAVETARVTLDGRHADGHVAQERTVVLPGEYVMLAVSDTGTGMSSDVQARIFEPFFTTKEAGKGTGLGLSTVYGIVKQSGGHIWVYSEPGHGTVFKLYFPRISNAVATPLSQGVVRASAGGSETILLVEDEDALRRLARRILDRQGYTVLESRNGREALERATQHDGPIDLVLTDVIMPEMSGRGLVERLRAVRPRAAILYMSGYTDDDVLRRGLFEPGARFVQKPFVPDELLRVVRSALDAGTGTDAGTGAVPARRF